MDRRLASLLEFVREFSEPQGPDPAWWAERDRREAEWVGSRTTDDLVALVSWLKEPISPPDWVVPEWPGWLPSLAANAAFLAGKAARDNRDPRLLSVLVELLAEQRHTERAVQLLLDMDESLYALVDGFGDSRAPIIDELAAVVSPELARELAIIAQSPDTYPDDRVITSAVLNAWNRLHPA
jgi:hypothetical protein